eukprot:gene48301-16672_t
MAEEARSSLATVDRRVADAAAERGRAAVTVPFHSARPETAVVMAPEEVPDGVPPGTRFRGEQPPAVGTVAIHHDLAA